MKQLVTDFFRSAGSEVKEEGPLLRVNLSPELARYFQRSHLQLVFNSQHLRENTELVTYGSYVFNVMYDLLKDHGIKTFLKLPKRISSRKNTTEDIQFCNGEIIRKRAQHTYQVAWYFNFKITYWFDEKIEEMCLLRVDDQEVITRCDIPPTELFLLIQEKQEGQKSGPPWSRNKMKLLYNRCLTEVERYAREQSTKFQEKLMERLYKNLSRLEVYYRQSRDEVTGTDEQQKERKLELLQQEYRLKVDEELDNHQIQILLSLINFCSIRTPVVLRRVLLKAYGKEREVVWSKNLFSGEATYPTCGACGNELHVAGICGRQAQIVCDKCLSHCQECDQDICVRCGIHACESCEVEICTDCASICSHCGKWFCNEHVFGCRLCKIEFCSACAKVCNICKGVLCGQHVVTCTICESEVCSRCKTSCSHCEEEVCNTHLVACSFCGQLTCVNCIEVCETCDCQTCTRHIYTCAISKKRLCPKDSNRCQTCHMRVSKAYTQNCDIGGEKICVSCTEACSKCQIPFCHEHSDELKTCDTCGEVFCFLCWDQRKVCPDCESLQHV